ncbi:MAG: nickel-dependent lactate racemase [Fusobacteriaceae bacterium]|jgi:nickel-dependent lactate racemase|nr:nickel-dependent lactate racemase [Fusobacteriaceae bacterium]
MPKVFFPYGKETLELDIPDNRFKAQLVSKMHHYKAPKSPEELVREALDNPVGSPKLSELVKGKKKILLIASDHTRPVPSKAIIPPMLSDIREANPDAEITILISTGCHRETTKEELIGKFGEEIVAKEKILVHDSNTKDVVNIGKLPSGGDIVINKLATEADLIISEGFIEPHFFAGYSGGRKSVLPGIVTRVTVLYNHNAEFIDSPYARTGIVDGNPIHIDMLHAARVANLAFICNAVIDADKNAVYVVAGDVEEAHKKGRDFLADKCQAEAIPADIAISTNGGYPLDQNIYQAVKGMTAAEAAVKKDGVIIMIAKSNDGHGGAEFFKTFVEEKDLKRMTKGFLDTPKTETRMDQWESQILSRILQHVKKVIYISDAPDEMVKEFQMEPCHSLPDALKRAEEILGNPNATVNVIPDGVSIMVKRVEN